MTSRRVGADRVSDVTLRRRDEEQEDLADEAFRAARDLISGHRAQLEDLGRTLLTREVLERADIDRIMADVPRQPGRRGIGEVSVAAATRHDLTRPES